METNLETLIQQAQGDLYWVLGDLYSFKATGKQTNGTFTVIDQVIQPQGGPPPHVHHREDESFYVLEGRFSFLKGDEQTILEAGAFAYIPKGTVHTFKNISEQQGRLLAIITPSGLEDFFYAIGTPTDGSATPAEFDPAFMPKLMQLAKSYHMDILLPESR